MNARLPAEVTSFSEEVRLLVAATDPAEFVSLARFASGGRPDRRDRARAHSIASP